MLFRSARPESGGTRAGRDEAVRSRGSSAQGIPAFYYNREQNVLICAVCPGTPDVPTRSSFVWAMDKPAGNDDHLENLDRPSSDSEDLESSSENHEFTAAVTQFMSSGRHSCADRTVTSVW